jgi:hypothetical protein
LACACPWQAGGWSCVCDRLRLGVYGGPKVWPAPNHTAPQASSLKHCHPITNAHAQHTHTRTRTHSTHPQALVGHIAAESARVASEVECGPLAEAAGRSEALEGQLAAAAAALEAARREREADAIAFDDSLRRCRCVCVWGGAGASCSCGYVEWAQG